MNSITTILKSRNKFVYLKGFHPSTIFAATICSKELLDPNVTRAKPFNYMKKNYSFFHWHFDGTIKRFDENTKIIVVDGNIGAGKTGLAKALAEQFGMKYVPEPSFDRIHITPDGFDLRLLDPIMPLNMKSCDVSTFYRDPRHWNIGKFQMNMWMFRYIDYIESLCHLLNYGDGIVMDRSVYSDLVFMNAMCRMGYVRKGVKDFYHKLQPHCLEELLRPHLIVYLDVTPEVALQRIKERNNPDEVNSEVFKNTDYLRAIDDEYKNTYLPGLAEHCEILVYDWNDYGDVEVIIEDIERIDFETYNPYTKKFKDWFHESDWDWAITRWKFTNQKYKLLNYARSYVPYEAPELTIPGEELAQYQEIMQKVPGIKYEKGFNEFRKGSILGVLFKWNDAPKWKHKIDYFPHRHRNLGMGLD